MDDFPGLNFMYLFLIVFVLVAGCGFYTWLKEYNLRKQALETLTQVHFSSNNVSSQSPSNPPEYNSSPPGYSAASGNNLQDYTKIMAANYILKSTQNNCHHH